VQALILAGGEGTRLRPLTSTVPKPVVTLVDRPFIAYMIEWLRRHGVDDVILSCGFMAERVREVLGEGSTLGVRIRYVEEPRPLGTGGAL
jgi:mannose-1-phosphate guanylyltransferase